jgi:hypothetical protein
MGKATKNNAPKIIKSISIPLILRLKIKGKQKSSFVVSEEKTMIMGPF